MPLYRVRIGKRIEYCGGQSEAVKKLTEELKANSTVTATISYHESTSIGDLIARDKAEIEAMAAEATAPAEEEPNPYDELNKEANDE